MSCSINEHVNAKLKACDLGDDVIDVITLGDRDHQSSNFNSHQTSSNDLQLIDRISLPQTDLLI
ncbi:hypothetical protein PGT21_012378 [Puccinia graminis f. sp. tritici]|uniref:Uncharacterized protein n=1 Tax=Puccinia graminis f. sp. tritici TaxID=56615 RepID=A0A5B0QAE3_PUCGR|nr:hypothetical protein PGT21_012378 [Puccinia graminis f. sp. tritici]